MNEVGELSLCVCVCGGGGGGNKTCVGVRRVGEGRWSEVRRGWGGTFSFLFKQKIKECCAVKYMSLQ